MSTTQVPSLTQPPLWNIPFRRNPFFTGREQVLSSLYIMLLTDQSAALVQPPAISGLGGIGKTQTAIEYAYRYHEEYHTIFWFQANSRETLIADITKIAILLHLPEQNARETELIILAVRYWLEVNTSWLLIFDNTDDLSVVSDILPSKNSGHIIFTTRATATGDLARRIEIDEMDAEEGALLLLRRAKILTLNAPLESAPEADLATARAIVEAMGGLPLALDQAGAYIEETGCNLSAYLQLYQTHRIELLKERGENKDYPYSVATTWALSFEKIQQANPAAADLLRLCAFLAPDDIPEEIIIEAPDDIGTELQSLMHNQHKLNLAIKELLKYSLIRRHSDRNTIVVHSLVQAVLKDGVDEEIQQQWAKRVILAVNQVFPDVEKVEKWPDCQQWLPHALICAEFTEKWKSLFAEATRLISEAGHYLIYHAQYSEAESLYQRALAISEEVLGERHPDTSGCLNNLGYLYKIQNKYVQTQPLYIRSLEINKKVPGEKHPATATNFNNLGSLYEKQGKYAQAQPLYMRALEINKEVLGEKHPHTVVVLNNLGLIYHKQGKYAEAEPLYKRVLEIMEGAQGEQHPETILSLIDLANLYHEQKKYSEAEHLYRRVLTIRKEVLGEKHQDIASTLSYLTTLYYEQEKLLEVEPLLKEALEIYEEVLGEKHLDTAQTRPYHPRTNPWIQSSQYYWRP